MVEHLLSESLLLVGASALVIGVCAWVGFSPIVGYLVAGLMIGPHGLGLLSPSEGTHFFAELGIVFLMFLVGLEFSLSRMIAARSIVFGLGGLQVAATTLLAGGAGLALGLDVLPAFLVGGAVAMSSTAIALKQLSDSGELNSQHGRIAVGVLLFQDLATLPLLVVVGALSTGADAGFVEVGRRLGIAAIAFLAVMALGRSVFVRVLSAVAATRSTELFLLTILAIVLGTAFAAGYVGLSLPLGAFLAGMVIGESDFRHEVEDDIRPFRDILLGLFFLTVGMQIDLRSVLTSPLILLAALAVLMVAKPLIVYLVCLAGGRGTEAGLRASLVLAQGGEFGLLILTQLLGIRLLPPEVAQPLLSAFALSMAAAPFVIQFNQRLAGLFLGGGALQDSDRSIGAITEASANLSNHVVLCGCGRIGRLVAYLLQASQVPYLAIEKDYTAVQRSKKEGLHVVFGDASRKRILEAAGLSRARLVIATFDGRPAILRLLHRVRHEEAVLPVIVSADDEEAVNELTDSGASMVLPENLAAGLAVGAEALGRLGFSHEEVAGRVDELRGTLALSRNREDVAGSLVKE